MVEREEVRKQREILDDLNKDIITNSEYSYNLFHTYFLNKNFDLCNRLQLKNQNSHNEGANYFSNCFTKMNEGSDLMLESIKDNIDNYIQQSKDLEFLYDTPTLNN